MAKKKKIVGIIGVNGEKQDLTKANEITQKLPKAPNIVGSVDVDGNITKYNQQVNPINSENKKLVIAPILTEEQKRQQAMEQSKVMREPMEVSMMKNNINNQIAKNIVSGGIQNDIHNMNMNNIGNQNNKIKFETYHNTGKKYGDYYYDNYELFKDKPIYERDDKYYLKTNNGYEEIGRLDKNGNVAQNVMTTKELDNQEYENAKKLGYKDNIIKITTQDYDDAQNTFKKLQKEYKLSDKELDNWIKTGDLPIHISIQTNSMNNLKQKAEEYRAKIGAGVIQQYDPQGFDINKQIYMDTHNMTDEEKQHYISFITGKKDPTLKNENTFFKGSSVFDDGYQFGDVTKASLGTLGNAGYSLLKGAGKFIEGSSDFAENVIGSGLELTASDNDKKDVTTIHNNKTYIGYKYGNQNYWYDEKTKTMYDDKWNKVKSFNLDRFQKRYTYSNGVAEFGRQMKEQTVKDEMGNFFDETIHGNDLRNLSVLGNKSEAMLESLGQALPLMGAGASVGGLYGEGSAVATTSGLTFASTYGNAKTEAIRNGATEKEAMQTAFVQATAETISEQFFDAIPGAKSAGWGEKLVGKVGSSVEKYMGSKTSKIVMKALDISGEGFEEIISNMLTAGGNDIVKLFDKDFTYGMENQTGNILDDMTKAMTSQDSMDSFISAIITSAILNAGSTKINSSKENQIIKEIVRTYAKEYNMSIDEAKSRLKINGDNVEFDTKNISQTQNTSNLPNNSTVEQRNINNNINNQVSENVQNSMVRTQNNNKVNPPISTTFLNSAKENNYNSNSEVIRNANSIMLKRGIEGRFDSKFFTNNSENALWRKDENGKRSVIFNPNADENAIFQNVVIHEMVHDVLSSKNNADVLNVEDILDFVSKTSGYESARMNLEETYSKVYDRNSDQFKEMVDEEVIATVLGNKLGSQEYINRLNGQKPNLARRIYNWIVNKLDSLSKALGHQSEKAYWRDVANRFEKAFNGEYNSDLNDNTKYMMTSVKGMNNGINTDNKNFNTYQKYKNGIEEPDNSSFSNDLSYQGTNHSGVKAYGKKITVDNMYKQIDNLAENNKKNGEALNVINSVKNNPNAKITIYRATPGNNINVGDWVFLTETEADRFSRAIITKQRKIGYKVLKMEVKAKDVDWTGKNLEFVFNPQEQNNYEAIDITNNDIRYSQKSQTWDEFVENNFKSSGTRTKFSEIKAPINPNAITNQNKIKPPIAKEYQKNTIEEKIDKKIETSSINSINNATRIANKYLYFTKDERQSFKEKLNKYENKTYDEIANGKTYNEIKNIIRDYSIRPIENIDEEMKSVKSEIRNRSIRIDDNLKSQIGDYNDFRKSMFGKLKLSNEGTSIDSLYNELSNAYPYYFNSNINTEVDMLYELADFMNKDVVDIQKYNLSEKEIENCTSKVFNELKNGLITDDKIQEIKENINNKKYRLTRKEVRNQLLNEMNITAEDLSVGDDIKSLNFQLTDPIRVNEKVFGRELGKKINEVTIEKTKHNEAERTRWLNSERKDIKDLGIKPRSKESAAVQKYGEKQYVNKYGETVEYGDKQLMTEFSNVETQEKIKRAAAMLRNKYDKYIDQINSTITALGYDEIPKRTDYMRHFQELGDIFSQTGVPFNLNDMKAEDLPTDINGLTEFNKPGKNWFASAQKRYGNKTTYDAITGIDGYLEGASNLIFHTEDIQRYRALSGLIRDNFGKTKGFENLDNLSNEEVLKRIDDIQHNKLSKYVAWLDEQANSLANKKGAIDRGTERILGRRGYTALNTIKKQVGSNMTGFNVRSAMTNFISSTIAASKTNKIAMVKGTIATIKNMFHNDGFINKSDFLTSRFGSDSLSPKLWNKISNAGQILMRGSDYFTSNQIVRSKYYEGLQKGMTEIEAIKYADDFGARVMGDRSKGSTAEVFNSKTLGLLTQFQLETNNQWQFMIHDSIMDFQKNSKINGGLKAGATILFQLGQLCAYSYFFNEFFEALTGSRAAFDPIDILLKLLGWGDDDKDKSFEKRMKEAGSELSDAIPFTSLFGKGGRMPISDALTPFGTTFDYLTGGKNSYGGDVTLEDVKNDTLSALPYYLLPTGYGQIKKTTKGLSMFSNEKEIKGSYSKSGRLRFPVKDTIGNRIKAGLFGEYASKEAREYFNNGENPLTDNQQNMFETLNIPISDYWTIKKDFSELKEKLKGEDKEERQEKIYEYIDSLNISQVRKDILKKSEYKTYTDGDNRIIKYINNSNMSKKSKEEILKKLGLDK